HRPVGRALPRQAGLGARPLAPVLALAAHAAQSYLCRSTRPASRLGLTAPIRPPAGRLNLYIGLAINGLKRPAILHPGDEIYVRLGPDMMPAPRTVHHVVVEGESAWTIAAIYNVTLDALLEANQLERPVILKPGDILVIPR